MMNKAYIFNNIHNQIRDRQKRLSFLRNLVQQSEETGKPADQLRRNIAVLLDEIRMLQNKIRQFSSLRKTG
jgi:hypothetical protein